MMKYNEKEFIWAEKYRPQVIDDIILPKDVKNKFKEWIDNQEIPHIGLFSRTPGTGKSSIENIIKNMQLDVLWINSSDERGIDTFRTKVQNFAARMPVKGKIRVVILSEADYLTPEAQALLRNLIEIYSQHTRFLITGNYSDKLIPPLMQRLQIFDFDEMFSRNKKELAKEMYKRLEFICKNEGVEYTKEDLLKLIKTYYPSMREMIINLQKNVIDGKLIVDNLSLKTDHFDELMELVKSKKFKDVREKLNDITDIDNLYSYLYNNLDKYFDINDQPSVIVDIATYQDYNYRAKNKVIPSMALIVKIWNKIKR